MRVASGHGEPHLGRDGIDPARNETTGGGVGGGAETVIGGPAAAPRSWAAFGGGC